MDDKTRSENAPDHLDFIELESDTNSRSDELETTTDQKGVVDRLQPLIKTITERENHQNQKSEAEQPPPSESVVAKQIGGQKHVADWQEETRNKGIEDPASSVAMALTILDMEKDEAERCSGYDGDVDGPFETRRFHPIIADLKLNLKQHDASSSSVNTIGGDYEEINSWQVPIPNSSSETSDTIKDPVSEFLRDSCGESCDDDEKDETCKKLRLDK